MQFLFLRYEKSLQFLTLRSDSCTKITNYKLTETAPINCVGGFRIQYKRAGA